MSWRQLWLVNLQSKGQPFDLFLGHISNRSGSYTACGFVRKNWLEDGKEKGCTLDLSQIMSFTLWIAWSFKIKGLFFSLFSKMLCVRSCFRCQNTVCDKSWPQLGFLEFTLTSSNRQLPCVLEKKDIQQCHFSKYCFIIYMKCMNWPGWWNQERASFCLQLWAVLLSVVCLVDK